MAGDEFSGFRGPAAFPLPYRRMMERDPHAPGSVDRWLLWSMVRLAPETAERLYGTAAPARSTYRPATRPGLEACLRSAGIEADAAEDARVALATRVVAACVQRASSPLESVRFGGTEEAILERGSDWCTDLARVACVLFQVAGLPARIAYLADIETAYSGHAITEVRTEAGWGAVDPTTHVVYRHANGVPASVWDLARDPTLVEKHYRGPDTPYTHGGQVRAAALATYPLNEADRFDYTVSEPGEYYRAILGMADAGWPGGIRWLFDEDRTR